jgi:hypothetical protein
MVRISKSKLSTQNSYPTVYVASCKRVAHDCKKELIERLYEFGLDGLEVLKVFRAKDNIKVIELRRTFDEMAGAGATRKELKSFLEK